MDHYKPHPSATFEGYYNKFDLPSGATAVLIISRVPDAPSRNNYVAFTYIPADPSSSSPVYQREFWPETLTFTETGDKSGFVLSTGSDGLAHFEISGDKGSYSLQGEGVAFTAEFSRITPWSTAPGGACTPEGALVHLPLPLHWHVHSLATPATFTLSTPGSPAATVAPADLGGAAAVHQEKNWAHSFPASHMWLQARSASGGGLSLAGGEILGLEAFLVGYRDPGAGVEMDFRPPFALRVPWLGLGPFMSFRTDWGARTFEICVQTFASRLEVRARAPKGSFYGLSAPFGDGHRANFLAQSMGATFEVRAWRRRWWVVGGWVEVSSQRFEGAALEFGGEYYPPRGSDGTSH